jgi:methionyl aminopeptidase
MVPRASGGGISLKSEREVELMRSAGEIVAEALEVAREFIRPGVTTAEVDARVEEVIRDRGGIPAFKGYRGFPAATCSSVNEEVVHGIPGKRRLNDGELLKLDVGVRWKHYHGDSAWPFPVGETSEEARRLCDTARESLEAGIRRAVAGNRLRDVAAAVENHVRKNGFSVVEQYVGHGIGWRLHEPPQIPNYVRDDFEDLKRKLQAGMVLAIEPMVNLGGHEVETLADGWTVVTRDRRLSAHYEHTVWISGEGPVILTRLGGGEEPGSEGD